MTPPQSLSSSKWSKPTSSLPPPKQKGWYHLSDKYFDSFYMTGAFPTKVQESLQLKFSYSFAKDTYNIEVGWICRTWISVHPGWDASLHMNNSSSHAVDVCFCCVASAEDNFRAHVNLWRIDKKRLINRGKQEAKMNRYILWYGKLPSEEMHPTSTCTKDCLGNKIFLLCTLPQSQGFSGLAPGQSHIPGLPSPNRPQLSGYGT